MAKKNLKKYANPVTGEFVEPVTDAPYDKSAMQAPIEDQIALTNALGKQAVDAIVAGYGAGNSIPDLLRAILTELVKIRVGGAHVGNK